MQDASQVAAFMTVIRAARLVIQRPPSDLANHGGLNLRGGFNRYTIAPSAPLEAKSILVRLEISWPLGALLGQDFFSVRLVVGASFSASLFCSHVSSSGSGSTRSLTSSHRSWTTQRWSQTSDSTTPQ